MRSSLQIFVVVAIALTNSIVYSQHKKFHEVYHPGDRLYVHAKAGLSLRQSAEANATVLTVVPFGQYVQVLPFTTQVPFSNSGINGVWVKVTYGNFQGYQFSGFLSRFPVAEGDGIDIRMRSAFQVKQEVTRHPDDRNYNQYLEMYFKNGIVFVWSAPEGGNEVTITFPQSAFTWQEVYLLARELRSDFFIGGKCAYTEDALACSGEYSSLSMTYTSAGDKFHPVPAIELRASDAD